MVHEAFLPFRKDAWRESVAAVVHRLMTVILLRAATRIWYTTPAWEKLWRPYAFGRDLSWRWLPMPSNVPIVYDADAVHTVRSRFSRSGGLLIGHFGTFGRDLADLVVRILAAVPPSVTQYDVLLIGPRGQLARDALIAIRPELAERVHTTGALRIEQVAPYINACDLMLQPYTDGVTTRRTSFMAGLALGRPTITTLGFQSEAFWSTSGAAIFGDPEAPALMAEEVVKLLANPEERARIGAAGRSVYDARFDIRHAVDALHRSG